ncbi:R-linalool synthase [Heracleum sosnowskyi]|uniref:R-linalool synthase n=1 Tax=Heracleum sosnowskyi TaxID=360622 RepID=A0AAD8IIK6_9APIA|nr:R-linalool synthase [Heracleum sosnowskyi]
MEDVEHRFSVGAPLIFIIIIAFQYLSMYVDIKKKKGSTSTADVQLRAEIKQLYKEANAFSQPSTFAQAAKLRRLAAAKEKELAKNQELRSKEISSSYDSNVKKLKMIKVFIYVALGLWFWRSPVAAVSEQLVQPFGRFLSWRSGGFSSGYVMIGIIPWLVVSTRVAKFACQTIFKY